MTTVMEWAGALAIVALYLASLIGVCMASEIVADLLGSLIRRGRDK